MEGVPAAAWLQYPVTAIVVFLVIYLLSRFEKFIDKQNLAWQNFLEKRDKEQAESQKKSNEALVNVIGQLTTQIECMDQRLESHDSETKMAITLMKERTSATKPTRRTRDPGN